MTFLSALSQIVPHSFGVIPSDQINDELAAVNCHIFSKLKSRKKKT